MPQLNHRDFEQILTMVREHARSRNVRWTLQRQTVVESFLNGGEHTTVEELHRRLRQKDQAISAATVYRTINMLVEIGVAVKRHFSGASATFECALNKDHHDHLVCVACATITEFRHPGIERMQDDVAKSHGFALGHHRLELFGLCKACQDKGVTWSPVLLAKSGMAG